MSDHPAGMGSPLTPHSRPRDCACRLQLGQRHPDHIAAHLCTRADELPIGMHRPAGSLTQPLGLALMAGRPAASSTSGAAPGSATLPTCSWTSLPRPTCTGSSLSRTGAVWAGWHYARWPCGRPEQQWQESCLHQDKTCLGKSAGCITGDNEWAFRPLMRGWARVAMAGTCLHKTRTHVFRGLMCQESLHGQGGSVHAAQGRPGSQMQEA